MVNLVLHWPGDFGKYISYGGSGRAGGHGVRQVVRVRAVVLVAAPARLARATARLPGRARRRLAGSAAGPLRRFLLALLAVNVVSSLAFLLYTAVGIDKLSEYYIGYFYWSAPLVTVLVIVLAGLEAVPRPGAEGSRLALRLSTGVAVLAAVAAVAVLAVIPGTRTSTNDIDESLPQVVATLAARAPGKTIVLHIDGPAWVETTGFLVQAERTGVKACLHDPWYTFLMTKQFICTPAQTASGQALLVLHAARPAAAHARHPALQRHGGRARVAMTHVGREQEAPALTDPPARTLGGHARQAGGPGRAGRGGPVLLLLAPVPGGAAVLGRRGERAAGVGHAAREPAAAPLVGVGRVLLHHRTAPVHAGRGPDRGWARGSCTWPRP